MSIARNLALSCGFVNPRTRAAPGSRPAWLALSSAILTFGGLAGVPG
jgi:hypothetical protein